MTSGCGSCGSNGIALCIGPPSLGHRDVAHATVHEWSSDVLSRSADGEGPPNLLKAMLTVYTTHKLSSYNIHSIQVKYICCHASISMSRLDSLRQNLGVLPVYSMMCSYQFC